MSRAALLLITAFWLAMNALLWRVELGPRPSAGAPVPVPLVWQKMLTAPDVSSLEIFHHGQRVGACRWAANVGEERATGQIATEEVLPEGLIQQLTGYTIDFDGNVMLKETGNNARFYLRISLTTNHLWQDLHLRLHVRPYAVQITTVAAEERLVWRVDGADGTVERTLRFDELRDPRKVLRQVGGPWAATLAAALGGSARSHLPPDLTTGLVWDARHDTLNIGRAAVRVYRLRARLLDRFEARVYVSRAGEILRVELPDSVVLLNYALTTF